MLRVAAAASVVVCGVSLLTCALLLHQCRQQHDPVLPAPCRETGSVSRSEYMDGPLTPFSELSPAEVNSVLAFLSSNVSLELRDVRGASIKDTFVHLMEARVPPKQDVLRWLTGGGPPPKRVAKVILFRGSADPPVVEEHEVGPLPEPTYSRLVSSKLRRTVVPFSLRPFSKAEFMPIFRHLTPLVAREVGDLLEESYGARLGPGCKPRCLRLSFTPVSSAFLPPNTRAAWFWLAYDLEFYTLHPLDLQILVDTTALDAANWTVERIFYAEQFFDSLKDLADRYSAGTINVTRVAFPEEPVEELYSSLHLRGDPFPTDDKPPPLQVMPRGQRFKVEGSRVHYLKWSLTLRVSPSVGLQLYDVNFGGERVAYEVSLQEIAVLYAGRSPAASMLYFADSAGLFGTRMRGLLQGVDCPAYATYLDTRMFTSNDGGLARFPRALCIFEHNSQSPLRRHRAYGLSGAFYGGLVDTMLIVRTYISVINYDYVIDYIFRSSGAIEVRIGSTGYLATSFYLAGEERYGTRVHKHVTAGMHQHVFHIKADLDVAGTPNTFSTWDVGVENTTHTWSHDPAAIYAQTYISKNVRQRESEGCYNYNFKVPKYLLISGGKPTELGNRRSYRVIPQGMSPAMLPPLVGFESSVPWARCQVAVTRHHDDEATSSSIFAMWDARDPVVNFTRYLADNENIENEDLVTWVTLGTFHIPHTENLPNTATVGTHLALLLTPFNYFPQDPSIASRDAVRVSPLDSSRPLAGAVVQRYNTSVGMTCLPDMSLADEDLKANSTELFV
ncbi:hypothetical protein C0Q70_20222 [Pomacea canaliculata]|uniref:Amine oxidase n=2 Tax=Pomacea canaliculata TaxID=400727 RepID=A0A2T7NEZ0_POMCA|nr:hypothetical protein C0Q70_20222 [Pomacea canaliculata]